MATIESIVTVSAESVFEIGDRLTGLLEQARHDADSDGIAENALARLASKQERFSRRPKVRTSGNAGTKFRRVLWMNRRTLSRRLMNLYRPRSSA